MDDPMKTIESFNRQFGLNEDERKAVEWAWPKEAGDMMFSVVNAYTRAAQFSGLYARIQAFLTNQEYFFSLSIWNHPSGIPFKS